MNASPATFAEVRHELEHLAKHWWWWTLLGGLLVVSGTAAIVFPPVMVGTSIAVPVIIGVILMIDGVAMIVSAFWAGKWGGFLIEILVGILYIAAGFLFTENPAIATLTLTIFIAISFIVLGLFRAVAALVMQFPQWGWALLNGIVTFVAGVVIYRSLPESALWVIGLLVGIELIFNGWTWVMLSLALRKIHEHKTHVAA